MDFRTEIEIKKSEINISYQDKILMLGSCFTNNIGEKLTANKFNVLVNPFGTIYNPVSIANSLDIITKQLYFKDEDLFFHNDLYSSFYHYSNFSHSDKNFVLENINNSIKESYDFLKESKLLIITVGTAFVYENVETGKVVSNCHKLPARQFKRYILKPDEVYQYFSASFQRIKRINPDIKIVFTISPIRHLKDGFELNQLSKSTIRLGIYDLIDKKSVDYFPSYEIVNDDLRDYRFYEPDMIHINNQAIDYIWEKFCGKYLDAHMLYLMKKVNKLNQMANHRPINPDSKEFARFKEKAIVKMENFVNQHPYIDFFEEIEKLKKI
jgi:hypothetical protein